MCSSSLNRIKILCSSSSTNNNSLSTLISKDNSKLISIRRNNLSNSKLNMFNIHSSSSREINKCHKLSSNSNNSNNNNIRVLRSINLKSNNSNSISNKDTSNSLNMFNLINNNSSRFFNKISNNRNLTMFRLISSIECSSKVKPICSSSIFNFNSNSRRMLCNRRGKQCNINSNTSLSIQCSSRVNRCNTNSPSNTYQNEHQYNGNSLEIRNNNNNNTSIPKTNHSRHKTTQFNSMVILRNLLCHSRVMHHSSISSHRNNFSSSNPNIQCNSRTRNRYRSRNSSSIRIKTNKQPSPPHSMLEQTTTEISGNNLRISLSNKNSRIPKHNNSNNNKNNSKSRSSRPLEHLLLTRWLVWQGQPQS